MPRKEYDVEEIRRAIDMNISYAGICRTLGITVSSSNYITIKKYINEYNIDTSHLLGLKNNVANLSNNGQIKSLDKIPTTNSYYGTSQLKRRLVKEGIKEYRCEICGLNEWNGEQIGLQLHHINGDRTDNRLENLQLLCPNCHSQTDNYCGANNKSNKKKYYCQNCGKEIWRTNKSGYCRSCYNEVTGNNKTKDLTRDILIDLYKTKTTKEIAEIYNVTTQCIRSLARKFNVV